MAQLVQKTKYTILSQCGESVESQADKQSKKNQHAKNTIVDTINTIATGSVTTDKDNKGFFSENAKLIAQSSKSIETAIEKISSSLLAVNLNGVESRQLNDRVQSFIS